MIYFDEPENKKMNKEKEFNLSEKIEWKTKLLGEINQIHVKEFMKEEEKLFNLMSLGHISIADFWYRRNKLAGDDLK